MTNSAVNCGFDYIYWRNPLWKTLFLCSNIIVSKKSAMFHLSFINLIKVIKTIVEHCINVFILTFIHAFTFWNGKERKFSFNSFQTMTSHHTGIEQNQNPFIQIFIVALSLVFRFFVNVLNYFCCFSSCLSHNKNGRTNNTAMMNCDAKYLSQNVVKLSENTFVSNNQWKCFFILQFLWRLCIKYSKLGVAL